MKLYLTTSVAIPSLSLDKTNPNKDIEIYNDTWIAKALFKIAGIIDDALAYLDGRIEALTLFVMGYKERYYNRNGQLHREFLELVKNMIIGV